MSRLEHCLENAIAAIEQGKDYDAWRYEEIPRLNASPYSEQFDKERKWRVAVSYHKYGLARNNFASGRVDAIATAERCIDAFKKDHNTEHLVDAANYLMFRYMYPMPGEYFKATDSTESAGTVGTPINMER